MDWILLLILLLGFAWQEHRYHSLKTDLKNHVEQINLLTRSRQSSISSKDAVTYRDPDGSRSRGK